MDMTQVTLIHWTHAHRPVLDTKRNLHAANKWGYQKSTRHVYDKKGKRESGEIIRNIAH